MQLSRWRDLHHLPISWALVLVVAAATVASLPVKRASRSVEADLTQGPQADSFSFYYPFAENGTRPLNFKSGSSLDLRQECKHTTPWGTMKSANKLRAVLDAAEHIAFGDGSVPLSGDVVEAGVANGGGVLPVIFYLACTGDLRHRTVHLFDSWQGLAPTKNDTGFHKGQFFKSYDSFMANVRSFRGVYSNQVTTVSNPRGGSLSWDDAWKHVNVVKGLFADTMPKALANKQISLLMCDGDMYSSTKDCMDAAGHQVPKGGVIVNDDYYSFIGCYQAVHDYIIAKAMPEEDMYVIPQNPAPFKYIQEISGDCTPPVDNSGKSGQCGTLATEASVYYVGASSSYNLYLAPSESERMPHQKMTEPE